MSGALSTELPEVLAVGAWLKNSACRLGDSGACWSGMHGDLNDAQACMALENSVAALLRDGRRPVDAFAHDLHPDFYSTRLALRLAAERGVPAIGVQHHHAHIASVMAEHAEAGAAIGLALDGVGLGSDGTAWGGELLWVGARGDWQRLGHLWPLGLPGGDRAAREPWRMAASTLHALGRGAEITGRFSALVGTTSARVVQQMLAQGLNCPPASSAGRWFDAAAAALGLRLHQGCEAEAAQALERAAMRWLSSGRARVAVDVPSQVVDGVLDLRPLLARLLDAGASAVPPDSVDAWAGWFHLALAQALAGWAADGAERTGCRTVCLGGGCFLNRVLTERLTALLERRGLHVLRPLRHSCGDAALALGQAWVAQRRLLSARSGATTLETFESLSCAWPCLPA